METILAIETATAACSASLLHRGEVFERFEILPQKHAQRILGMVDEVLAEAQVTAEAVDALAFGRGPGAFTGVRIATGVIQGLALGWDRPVIGVSSLEALALAGLLEMESSSLAERELPVEWVSLLDARMNECYCQLGTYDPLTQAWHAQEPQLLNEEALAGLLEKSASFDRALAFGDIDKAFPDIAARFSDWSSVNPTATAVVRLAQWKRREGHCGARLQEAVPLPLYLRNEVAETLEQRRKRMT